MRRQQQQPRVTSTRVGALAGMMAEGIATIATDWLIDRCLDVWGWTVDVVEATEPLYWWIARKAIRVNADRYNNRKLKR